MNRGTLLNLTTLRFLAALSVFLHHLDSFGLNVSSHVWNLNLGWAVSFFYVLSGFVLSYSYEGRIRSSGDAASFMIRRFVRLWPLHAVCAVLYVMLIGYGTTTFLQTYLFATLQQAWVPSYGTGFAINSVAWSISVELFFYLAFPFIIVLPPRKLAGLFTASLFLLIASIVAFSLYVTETFPDPVRNPLWYESTAVTPSSYLLFFPLMRLPEFLSGIIAYKIFMHWRLKASHVQPIQLVTILCLVGYMTIHASIANHIAANLSAAASQAFTQYGMFPLFAWVVFVFAHGRGIVSDLMALRLPVYLGQISFAFYMIHQVIIRFLAAQVGLHVIAGPVIAALVAFLCSLAMAVVLHHSVEEPSMRWAKRRFGSERR